MIVEISGIPPRLEKFCSTRPCNRWIVGSLQLRDPNAQETNCKQTYFFHWKIISWYPLSGSDTSTLCLIPSHPNPRIRDSSSSPSWPKKNRLTINIRWLKRRHCHFFHKVSKCQFINVNKILAWLDRKLRTLHGSILQLVLLSTFKLVHYIFFARKNFGRGY